MAEVKVIRFLPLLFAALPSAYAQVVDISKVPDAFCADALTVAEQTPDCPANGTFIREAKACLDSLNRTETALGAQAIATAKTGTSSQAGETGTARKESVFSSAALAYLMGVADVAEQQLMLYHAYVVMPSSEYNRYQDEDPEEPTEWADEVGCFHDAHEQLSEVEKAFHDKNLRYGARHAEALAMEKQLGTAGTNYGSMTGAVQGGSAQGSGAPVLKGNSPSGGSNITGVSEEKSKGNQSP